MRRSPPSVTTRSAKQMRCESSWRRSAAPGGPTRPRCCWPHAEQAPARARARRLLLVRAEKGGWFDDNDKPFELVDHTPQGSGVQSSEFIRAYNNSKPTKLAADEYKPCLASSVPARKRLAAERTAAMEEAKSRSSPKPLPHPGNAAPGTPLVRLLVLRLYSHTRGGALRKQRWPECMSTTRWASGGNLHNAPSTCCSPASRSKAYGPGTNLGVEYVWLMCGKSMPSAPKCYSNVCQCGQSTRTTVGVL